MKRKVNIKREEEQHITIAFSVNDAGQGLYGTAIIKDGELTKLDLNPSGDYFSKWFKTKARLTLLRRFLKAVEKEIVYVEPVGE